ncbi:MAG: UDP-N-acetylmuramoyl-L-alanyl-D-glutamate--2,6-diaminopimelate ligase, partial [Clostridia bacterium]|nr:UDP-N-acetylmuramoyl-L-alanyl-D-glutamate--2,6-diaminopimelate ligase [Clostridia bacterium]
MKLCKIIGEIKNNKLAELEIKGITCDSRKVEEGFLFFCIKGVASDGHKFANVALEKGAAAIVCQYDLGLNNQIIVENSRIAYAEASCNWFDNPSKKMKMIGVTGTNGKTSVTYMLKAILEQTGAKVGLVGTIQHLVGDKVFESKNTTP